MSRALIGVWAAACWLCMPGQLEAQATTSVASPASSASAGGTASAPAADGGDAQGLLKLRDADMSDQSARAHFKVGTSLYDSGRFEEAAQEWEQAYALSQRTTLLYNIYVAYRDASDQPKAIDALRRYLTTSDPDATQRINLEARLHAMENAQASWAQTHPPSAEPTPSAAPSEAPAPAAPPPATQSQPQSSRSIWPVALLIGGGALLAGSLVTGLVTAGKVSKIEDSCPKDRCPSSFDLDDKRNSARTLATVTDVLLVSGVVVAGAGLVLYLTGGSSHETSDTASARASTQLSPAFACGPNACAASLSGRF